MNRNSVAPGHHEKRQRYRHEPRSHTYHCVSILNSCRIAAARFPSEAAMRRRPRLLDCQLEIEPKPVALADCLDATGNSVTHAWFTGSTENLTITSKFEVETLRNPFDYLLDSSAQTFPFAYLEDLRGSLSSSCLRLER